MYTYILYNVLMFMLSCSVGSNSLRFHVLKPTRLLCAWDFPDKYSGVGCHFLLHGIFPTQGPKPPLLRLLHWQTDSLPTVLPGKSFLVLRMISLGSSLTPISFLFPISNQIINSSNLYIKNFNTFPISATLIPVIIISQVGRCN